MLQIWLDNHEFLTSVSITGGDRNLHKRSEQMQNTMTAVTMLATSIGFAVPLDDYSAGKTSVDLTWRKGDNNKKVLQGIMIKM